VVAVKREAHNFRALGSKAQSFRARLLARAVWTRGGLASCIELGDRPQMAKIPFHPSHPERVCWGCDKYCPADDLTCGNGSERTPHPIELFGDDWYEWSHSQQGSETQSDGVRRQVLDALREVVDPELGLNVVDLGLVYRVAVDDSSRVEIDLSMTTPACPLGEHLLLEAEQRIRAVPEVRSVEARLVWDPPWQPERMSGTARAALGWKT
jgi:metal-sulfur cluster biosynthetic enzyme